MAKTNVASFVREVRAETSKVTWPNKKETVTTTILVFVMTFLMAMFLFFADWLISIFVEFILGAGA